MCEAKWPSLVAYVSMDHIFFQIVYRTDTDEIGALKKKCTCVPLCSAVVSNISQRRKLNPSFSSQFTCLKKQTSGGFVVIYTPRLRNEIISLILWYIFIAFRQIQLVWSLIIKLWYFVCRRAGLEVTLKYSAHLLLSNGLFSNRRFCFTNLIHDSLLQ